MRKTLSLLMCLMLAWAVWPVTGQAAESPRVVTWGMPTNVNVEDFDTNAYTLRLEELFNIDIHFFLMEEVATKFSVLVSSGSTLPDVVTPYSIDATSIYNYSSRGVFAPLTAYWNDPEMTKTFDAVLAETGGTEETRAYILSTVTMPDGQIYTIPSYEENVYNLMPYRMWINAAWLKTLGMEIPTTTEEFRAILEAFVNGDPNQNGKQDEFGLIGVPSGYGNNITTFLLNAFLDANPDVNYLAVKDGKVKPAYIEPAFKQGLEYLQGLCADGLLSPLSFTQDTTQLKAILNAEENIAGCVPAGNASYWTDYLNSPRFAEYDLLEPLIGPDGARFTPAKVPAVTSKFFVTASAQDPAFLFSIGEKQYDLDLRNNARYGLEGVNWSKAPEDLERYIGTFEALGYKPRIAIINDIWGKVQNAHWGNELTPYIMTQSHLMTENATRLRTPENENQLAIHAKHYLRYPPHAPQELLGQLIFTAEESDRIALIQTAIIDYVKENMTAFITGNQPFSQWDRYVQELMDMGLEEYVALQQAAYDRQH